MRRRLELVAVCAVALFAARCLQDPRQVSAGGHLTLTTSNASGGNVQGGTFDAKTITGNYNGADRKPGTDAGYAIITGTPNPLDQDTCKGVGIGLVGKPETGKSWQLAYVRGDPDGGVNDAGVQPVALGEGIGTLSYSEGCINKGSYNQWRSTGGTLTITSVEDPAEQPQGATPGANKTVKFTFSNVTMASDGEPATGTFTANGDGEVLLFTGMNQ